MIAGVATWSLEQNHILPKTCAFSQHTAVTALRQQGRLIAIIQSHAGNGIK